MAMTLAEMTANAAALRETMATEDEKEGVSDGQEVLQSSKSSTCLFQDWELMKFFVQIAAVHRFLYLEIQV